MDRLIYIAMNGAKSTLERQAVVSNNMANASTTGYRAAVQAFRALPVVGPGAPTRTFVVDSTPGWDTRAAPIVKTGRALDVAVRDEGWIAVMGRDLREAYTRAGDLQISRSGQLQTREGLNVMGETCVQYFFFSIDNLRQPDGAKWVCSPPMRTPADNVALWDAIRNNKLQAVSTDHCPFLYDGTQPIMYEGQPFSLPGKELGNGNFTKIPNGVPGIEDRMLIMWSHGVNQGQLSLNRMVEVCCTNPAKIFGLYPQKGTLAVGSDADVVIWDPVATRTYGVAASHQRTDYNLYEGWELRGLPEKVFLRGNLLVDGDTWNGEPGGGQWLRRSAHSPIV